MPFRNAWVLDKTRFSSGNVNDLWVRLKGEGIPFKSVAIWPGVWPPGRPFFEATIDILARILRGDVYAKWRSPNPPPVEFLRTPIEEAVQTMTKDEKKQALEQVRIFQDYGKLLEQILNKALGQK
jgi:hypothetical protein